MNIRIFLLILILVAIDVYAFQAVKLMAQQWTAIWRNTVFTIYWSITALAIGTIAMAFTTDVQHWNKAIFTIVRAVIFIAYLSKAITVIFLLVDDLRRLFIGTYEYFAGDGTFSPGRSKFLSQMALFLGGLPFATLTYGILRNPYRYKIYRAEVAVKNLPAALEGLKIVQISDIHSGSFFLKEPVENSVKMINEEAPDLVFFTGDLVNNEATEIEPYLDIFKKIESKYGVYSILGNHDYGDYQQWPSREAKQANMQRLANYHRAMGWDLLRNENRILNINGAQLAVLGIENYSTLPHFQKKGDLALAYTGAERADVKLLLSHDPTFWEYKVTKEYKDIAVTFSGHTHGFQFGIEIPGIFRWSPSQYVYKHWAGLYSEKNQYLYVNRGLGFLGYPGRVGILPEITALTLTAADS